jgi:hypothetical protein
MECAIQAVWHSLKISFTEVRNTTHFRKYQLTSDNCGFPAVPDGRIFFLQSLFFVQLSK